MKVILKEQFLLVIISFKQLEPMGEKIFNKSQVAKLINTSANYILQTCERHICSECRRTMG